MRKLYFIVLVSALVACSDDGGPKPVDDAGVADSGDVTDMTIVSDSGRDVGSNPTDMSAEVDASTDMGRDMAVDMAAANPCGFRAPSTLEIYRNVDGLRDDALLAELNDIVSPHNGLTYDEARTAMYVAPGVDVDDSDNTIECIYTGIRVTPDGTRSPQMGDDQITTEHSWPRNEGAETFPAEGDMHHLFPATAPSNNRRGVHPFGITDCDDPGEPACNWAEGGSQLGEGVDGQPFVFEVRPEFRGDVARAHFYFAARYELNIPAAEESVLRDWHCEDPPDLDELIRNDLVENVQQNRNPFVDRPRLVDEIVDF